MITATLLASLLLLSGCGSATYKADVPAKDVTAAVKNKISVPSGYETYDADFLDFYIPDATKLVADWDVVYAIAPDDYTEIGVLKAKSSDEVSALETAVKAYLDDFRTTYQPQAEQYDPSEQQKLKDAGYRVYGEYVVYTIMVSETQKTCHEIVDGLLKAK